MRASPKNPLKNVTNYKSAGWRKDLGHVPRAFYRYNCTSFKEAEWNDLKAKFFEHLAQHQEWRAIKENKPLQYMSYMESHFHTITSIKLKRLGQFMGWIKPGSYYHAVVARKGQLHKCLHLAGIESPKWPQVRPSQSCPVTQKEEETPPTSLQAPGEEGGVTQGARSNAPTPMETGGAGDGSSWVEQVEASNEEEWRGRPTKHHWSPSRRREGGSTNPFPLQDHEGRCEAAQQLYRHTGELRQARHNVAAQGMAHHHPDMQPHEVKSLNNQVLCMISEYHLTSLSQGSSCVSPVPPEAVKDLLSPVEEYLAESGFQGTRDLRVLEKAQTLRVAIWLHCLDMAAAGDGMASFSLDAAWHGRGPLVEFLLAQQASSLTFEEVVCRVLSENWDKAETSLNNVRELQAGL